jgi:hypothetical protein
MPIQPEVGELVAVYYSRKFYIGKVVKVIQQKNGKAYRITILKQTGW